MQHSSLITGIAHVGIRVHELARSRAFYELFGFEFIKGPVGPEPVAILKHPAGIEINLVLNAAQPTPSNVLMDHEANPAGYTHLALRVSSLRAVLELFRANGIEISGGPIEYPGGGRGVFVRDPDRNVLECYEDPSATT